MKQRFGDFVKHRGLKWYDTTSYSRDGERIPTCWTADVGDVLVVVLSSHLYYPGKWVSQCHPFWDTWETEAATREEAMDRAIDRLRGIVAGIVKDMPKR